MNGFKPTEPQYGDKKKIDEQVKGVPIERPKKTPMGAAPMRAAPPEETSDAGFNKIAPHMQNHLWGANFFLKKANEPRPRIGQADEIVSARLFAAQMALDIYKETGDEEIRDLAEDIMDGDVDPYSVFGMLAAAKMDDIDISEGRWTDGTFGQPDGVAPPEEDAGDGQPEDAPGKRERAS